ncbi:hypothetical protein MferCBS31731_000458 [Microsporum ferrugineum]
MAEPAQCLEEDHQEIGGVDQWGDYIAAIKAFKAVASNSYGPPPATKVLAPVTNAGPSDAASPTAPVQASDAPAKAALSPHPSSSGSKAITTDNPVTSHQAEATGAPFPAVNSPLQDESPHGVTPGISSAATAKNTSSTKREDETVERNETPVVDSNEAQNSQLTAGDSNASDEVVFRQDELRIVGPNIPYTFRKDETLKTPKALGHIKMSPPQVQEPGDHQVTDRRPPSRGRNHRKHNPPARSAHIQDSDNNGVLIKHQSTADQIKEARKAELLAFQKKEMQRYGKKVMGLLSDESPETMPLYLARQGPGVDPDSVFCNQHPLYLLTGLAERLKDETNEAQRSLERGEIRSTDEKQNAEPAVNGWALGNFANAVAVDWQYRPWEKYGDEFFAQKFRQWLDKTMRIGFIVDMTQEDFKNGEYHANLDTGMGPATFICPETLRDPSDAETLKHAHETAIGYVHNWNLRIRQEQERKDLEERERRRLAILPKPALESSKLVPYAPKINMYIRPVEPKDITALVELFNWYVRNTLRRADLEEITYDEMREHIEELRTDRYPFLVAVERHPKAWHAMNHEAEMLHGFCCISDFSGPLSTQRFTCDIELFVHPKRFKLGVGSCLLDKMVEICDPKYRARGGYTFDCAPQVQDVYTSGLSRPVMRLAAVIHHSNDEAAEYSWVKKWLSKEFNFQEQGYLRGIGVNKKILVNAGYMVYNTSIGIPESR